MRQALMNIKLPMYSFCMSVHSRTDTLSQQSIIDHAILFYTIIMFVFYSKTAVYISKKYLGIALRMFTVSSITVC